LTTFSTALILFLTASSLLEATVDLSAAALNCTTARCTATLQLFASDAAKHYLYVSLSKDLQLSNIASSDEFFSWNSCQDFSSSSQIASVFRPFNLTLWPHSIPPAFATPRNLPCGIFFAVFFLMPSNFSLQFSDKTLRVNEPAIPSYRSPLVQGLDLSTAPSYWHWAQNLNGSLQNSFLIGSIDQALPQNFTVSFSRGVDFGVGYTLVIRSAGSDLNLPFSVLMFLFSGVLTGVLVHVKMKTRAFEKFRL